jgi:hypothetical protein
MIYTKVNWIHNHPDDPIVFYSEIDDQRWEKRKVEVFRDGQKGFADATEEVGGTGLSIGPWPEFSEITSQPVFELEEITQSAFEVIWANRREREHDAPS